MDSDWETKYQYVELCNDDDIKEIKRNIHPLCLAFIDILGFKHYIEDDIDSAIYVIKSIETLKKGVSRELCKWY